MASKGSGPNSCCCTSCEIIPHTVVYSGQIPQDYAPGNIFSFGGKPIDQVQGFCCMCLPAHACVTLYCPATDETTRSYIPVNCGLVVTAEADAELYQGTVYLGGQAHTAHFTLNAGDDLKCFFCLEIPSLGFEKQCLEITQQHMVFPLMWCKTLTYEIDSYGNRLGTTFIGSVYECENLQVNISLPSVKAITGRQSPLVDSYGTVGPAFTIGAIYQDNDSIKDRCQGCGCIATTACLTVYHVKDGTSAAYTLNLGCEQCDLECTTGHIYSSILGDYGPLVSIEADPNCAPGDPTCDCYLKLVQVDHTLKFNNVYSGPITKGTTQGSCPFPKARWVVQDASNESVIVDFRTEACQSQPCAITASGCCVGVEMPTTLHVTIERTGGFVAGNSCLCLPVTIPMLFDGSPINPAWTGRLDAFPGDGSWCSGGSPDFKVRLVCGGINWRFIYGAGEGYNAAPCSGQIEEPGEFTCRPIYLRYTVDGICCGPSGIPAPPPQQLVFTITE